jgi:branched-chain amino acid transport system substrate-binding protein
MFKRLTLSACLAGALCIATSITAFAETVGVTDKEILIGGTHALSGPASAYGTLGRSAAGYFKMVNEKGGVNGRKIEYLLRDDGYLPPRSLEQTRKLVEQDKVAFIATPQGSLTSLANRQYLNDKKVPQLFVGASLSVFSDQKNYPWTMGSFPSGLVEGREMARHILKTKPNATIAFLMQNDDAGKDYKRGIVEVLGPQKAAAMKEVTFELSDPSVDSQVLTLAETKADAFIVVGPPKVTAQAIRKAYDMGWKPSLFYVISYSSSVEQALTPAGLDRSKGVISPTFMKDPADPQWANDAGIKQWVADMNKYNPGLNQDMLARMGWLTASMTVEVLRKAGNDLSRENIMKQAQSMDMDSPLLLPGLKVSTSPTNHAPISRMRLQQFDGTRWNLLPD